MLLFSVDKLYLSRGVTADPHVQVVLKSKRHLGQNGALGLILVIGFHGNCFLELFVIYITYSIIYIYIIILLRTE